jgi:hypothetical protein
VTLKLQLNVTPGLQSVTLPAYRFFPHKYDVFILFRILRKLQALLILNESLKQQDADFREQCKVELGKLQKLVRYVC